jgi:hypothetical protein
MKSKWTQCSGAPGGVTLNDNVYTTPFRLTMAVPSGRRNRSANLSIPSRSPYGTSTT